MKRAGGRTWLITPGDHSDVLTMLSVLSAAIGLALASQGQPRLALISLVLCGILDSFDGRFASRFKRTQISKHYGAELDSLSDILAFGALPATILLAFSRATTEPQLAALPKHSVPNWYATAVAALYLLSIARRLAWFGALDRDGAQGGNFIGLPSTYAALILPILITVTELVGITRYSLVMSVGLLLLALAFVAHVRLKRPSTMLIIVLSILGLACALRIALTQGL